VNCQAEKTKLLLNYINIPVNNKLSHPINAAKGQLRNVESAVVNMASSYFL
jgi:hypothetical protein